MITNLLSVNAMCCGMGVCKLRTAKHWVVQPSCVRLVLSSSLDGVCLDVLLKVSPLLTCSIYSPGSCFYPTWCKLDGITYSKVLKATLLVIKSHCVYCICRLLNKFIAVFKVVVSLEFHETVLNFTSLFELGWFLSSLNFLTWRNEHVS